MQNFIQMKPTHNPFITKAWYILPLLTAFINGSDLRAADFKEDFNEEFFGVADKMALATRGGWSLHYGEKNQADEATVQLNAGFSGQGARIKLNEQYIYSIPNENALMLSDGKVGEFRIKLRVMAPDDSWSVIQILIGSNDGAHGLAIRFHGGAYDGPGDNSILLSREGPDWGHMKFNKIDTATWKQETWYQIVISDIAKALDSSKVPAKVTIYEASNPSKIIVHNAPIDSVGTAGVFSVINVIALGNGGTAKMFDIDDLSLKSVGK